MVRERIPEEEAMVDDAVIDQYVRWSQGPMRYTYREVVARATSRIRGRVLDVGTGFGMLAIVLAERNPDVEIVGLDVSGRMIGAGKRLVEQRGLASRISFELADARRMPFPDDHFDAVVSYGSLHHWSEPVPVLDEIDRVRKRDGVVYVADIRRDIPRPCIWIYHAVMLIGIGSRLAGEMSRSVDASYVPAEIEDIMSRTTITHWRPEHNFYGIKIFSGRK